jgi:primary-amine oxidase
LSQDEIATAVSVLKAEGKATQQSLFLMIALHEPPKAEVLRFQPGGSMRREAFVQVYERAQRQLHEAVVDLSKRAVISWKAKPGSEPAQALESEYEHAVPQAVRADRRWQEAMKRRGIADLNNVVIDAWPPGYFAIPEDEGRRLAYAMSYYRGTAQNQYARPIEGVVAVVDMTTGEVLRVADTGVVPLPPETADLDPTSIGKQQASKPLGTTEPKGSGFEIMGNAVRWQNWHFRFGFTPREGLVLYTAGYQENGKIRPVLYRGSVSELAMFYSDPSPAWFFRNVLDEGEVGLGLLTASLEPGADAPANAHFIDGLMPTESGGATQVPKAMAVYERDAGILWKHNELEGGHNETRRSTELVLSSVATISNYDYCFNWVFQQDGTLEMEVILTGIVEPQGVAPGDTPKFAQRLTPNLAAVHHQHWFNFRLDLDVDGAAENSVVEMNAETLPAGRYNPHNRAFVEKETVLATEREAQRQLNAATGRMWKVINTGVRNTLGQPVGYALVTGENSLPFLPPDSWPRKRMGYVNAHLWVTPYEPDELYATGDYPYQGKGNDGLPKWTTANRSIANKDVVLWYTMGIAHTTRPEDWPVMNAHKAGFKLVPWGFFARNPALNVPPVTTK